MKWRRKAQKLQRRILVIKPTSCTNFSNVFWNETLHVSDSSSVHHQESFTVHTAMVYVIQICRQLASRIRMEHAGLVCRAEIPPYIPDSHLYRMTITRCRIGTVFSSDDGHTVARNMQRKAINILRKFVHQAGSIYKRLRFPNQRRSQECVEPCCQGPILHQVWFRGFNKQISIITCIYDCSFLSSDTNCYCRCV